ncbi:TNT domain-containing protein [Tamlana sp. 2201CG12-4]|uniref:TNT domain-containing protein n=1 Tax=Tamlana sp. 2201CG12-4 TaxID=3112582 RepID=UPI002DBA06B7|nr:TNT domain-containing protein [Tamlana sp. 2201CG12-4]MEC3907481.1 TNT domain-containing protein [Tamlana sp. 2201CG12-4]
MKKIYKHILIVFLFIGIGISGFGQIRRFQYQHFLRHYKLAEYQTPDARNIYRGISRSCNCESGKVPDFTFKTHGLSNALYLDGLLQRARDKRLTRWFNDQKNILKKEIEKQLGRKFTNFTAAQKAIYKNRERTNVLNSIGKVSRNYRNKVDVKNKTRARCLRNLKLLDFRAKEIKSGKIKNTQYGHLKFKSTPLSQITSISQINTLKKAEIHEFTNNQWRLDKELKAQKVLNEINSNAFHNNPNHELLNELYNKQLSYYNSYGWDKWRQLNLMQLYVNDVDVSVLIVKNTRLKYYGYSNYVENYALRKSPANLSVFHKDYWRRLVPYYHRQRVPNPYSAAQAQMQKLRIEAIDAALNTLSTDTLLRDAAIAGLGGRNEKYIKERPNLKAEIANYFKLNNYSKTSNDCINYLLNQYLGNGHFSLDKDYYTSKANPVFNSATNPGIAMGTSLNKIAVQDAFTYFNNVLAALLNDNVHRPEYKGQIIREMFQANGVNVPAGIDNAQLSNYFNFAHTTGNKIQIDHTRGHGNKSNLDRYLRDLKEFHNQVQGLLSNSPPAGSSAFAYIDYENRIAEVLQFTNDSDALEVAKLFQTDAAQDAFLNLTHHNAIAHCGRNILQTGFSEQLEFKKLDAEGLEIIAKEAAQVAAIEDIAEELNQNSSFWPQNAQEWGAFVEIMAPLIGELVLGFVPGSDAIELFRSISNKDVLGASVAMAGLIVDIAGLSAVKGAIKGVKVFRKALKISRKLGRVLRAAGKAAKKGFKTTLDAAGNLVLRKGDKVIAQGDGPVKEFLEKAARWTDEAGNIKWPPNNGFKGAIQNINLPVGLRIDRYGKPTGKFTSPTGTPRGQRTLAPGTTEELSSYRVIQPIPAKAGEVAPWFDEVGGGTQYQFENSIQWLLDNDFLEKI